jgi:hypothetical protein
MIQLSGLLLSIFLVHGNQTRITLNIPLRSKTLAADQSHQIANTLPGSVTLETRTIVLPYGRKGEPYPNYKEATIRYPAVGGLKNRVILQSVQMAISLNRLMGQSIAEMDHEYGGWLDEIDYTVNFNQNNVLDLTYLISGTAAYPDSYEKRVSVNLQTGKVIRVKDLFKADALSAIAQVVDKMMQREIQEKIAEFQQEEPDLAVTQFAGHRFQVKNLEDFNIGKTGVTFHYNFGFPHVIKAAEPSGDYLLSYNQLIRYIRNDGALGFLVECAKGKSN